MERRENNLAFFREMEQNIISSLERRELIPAVPLVQTKKEGPPKEPKEGSPKEPTMPPQRVRTISGMDDLLLLAELRDDANDVRQQQPQRQTQSTHSTFNTATTTDNKRGRPPLPIASAGSSRRPLYKSPERAAGTNESSDNKKARNHSFLGEDSELAGEKLLDAPIQTECDLSELKVSMSHPTGRKHTRRNTGGTIYLKNTMMNPDIKATIKCVCGVYRAHIVQAAEHKANRSPVSVASGGPHDVEVFRDDFESSRKHKDANIPSLADVSAFYEEFYRRSQLEHDTIIMSLIYVERLIKTSDGVITPTPENWKTILFSCMVLASKVWDDLSMWNIDFSNVSASTAGLSTFSLHRINELELALLKCLNFDVKVPASEYAKYYFLIRSMLLRSGLVQGVEKPLGNNEAFHTLEARTSNYQGTTLLRIGRGRRTKSMDDNFLV
jgi:hypothetical protein